ncbi:MAG: hypothetical protein ACRDPE_15280 [Solirubrobacterales bacterium]
MNSGDRQIESNEPRGWAALGYVAAVIVPVLGVVIAVPVNARGEDRHVKGILLTALASFLVHLVVLGTPV